MTHREWQTSDNPDALYALLAGHGDARRWRLYSSACLREFGHLFVDQNARRAFLTVQEAAEGAIDTIRLKQAHADAVASSQYLFSSRFPRSTVGRRIFVRMQGVTEALVSATLSNTHPESHALLITSILRHADAHDPTWERRVCLLCCEMMRDIFGDPFHPIELPATWLHRDGRQAVSIAATIYEDRTFDELPILADALEDAGCPVAELVQHCRQGGAHGRGCWVVDALMGHAG